MNKRFVLSTIMILTATPFCYASGYTLAVANNIILILLVIVLVLVALGCYGLHYNRIISQRNEQLRRILTALDDYRATVGHEILAPVKVQNDEEQSFFVKMDARVNKERPFTNPDFDHYALVEFMGVSNEEFCKLVPRYTEPARTLDYINSLRAEYAAKILMEQPNLPINDIAGKCGFRDTAAFNKVFKFAFGITPNDFLSGISHMFKKKEK